MKVVKKYFMGLCLILSFAWQVPQVIVGVVFLFTQIKWINTITYYKKGWHISLKHFRQWGISFGPIIFTGLGSSLTILRHEYGHSLQSLVLGPFFLLLIGFPSLIRILLASKKGLSWYLSGYPERWAQRWGGNISVKSR